MTRRVNLPTEEQVNEALNSLRTSTNHPITSSGLASHLMLSNSTFWRHFPDIAQRVSDERRVALRSSKETASDAEPRPDNEAKLRRELAILKTQFELAIAHIQRLSIENETLRHQAESFNNITRLRGRADR